jgi:hypothetical protein
MLASMLIMMELLPGLSHAGPHDDFRIARDLPSFLRRIGLSSIRLITRSPFPGHFALKCLLLLNCTEVDDEEGGTLLIDQRYGDPLEVIKRFLQRYKLCLRCPDDAMSRPLPQWYGEEVV